MLASQHLKTMRIYLLVCISSSSDWTLRGKNYSFGIRHRGSCLLSLCLSLVNCKTVHTINKYFLELPGESIDIRYVKSILLNPWGLALNQTHTHTNTHLMRTELNWNVPRAWVPVLLYLSSGPFSSFLAPSSPAKPL